MLQLSNKWKFELFFSVKKLVAQLVLSVFLMKACTVQIPVFSTIELSKFKNKNKKAKMKMKISNWREKKKYKKNVIFQKCNDMVHFYLEKI